MNRNLTLSFAITLVTAVILQACTRTEGNSPRLPKITDPIPVIVQRVPQSTAPDTIHVSGSFTTDNETVLSFKIGGVVQDVFVDEGDAVHKGQLLARLRQEEIDAIVSQAEEQFSKAKRDYERVQNLHADSVATLEHLENSRTVFSMAREQLRTAKFNRRFSAIYAAGAGYVLRKFVQPGQVVATGTPVLVTNGTADGSWILKAAIPDRQWRQITGNERAIISTDDFSAARMEGVVIRKSKAIDPASGLFSVDIRVNPSNMSLATGMFAKAAIITNEHYTCWRVPYESVLDANGDSGFVFITRDGKKATKVPVTIRAFQQEKIELGSGLNDDDQLIISGSAYLSDNSPILIEN